MTTFADFFAKNEIAVARKITNSQAVRNCIAEAKAKNEGPEYVIKFAVDTLGMEPVLARRYVKENWDRPTELTRARKVNVAKAKADGTAEVRVTKSSLVREQIAVAKRNNLAPETVVAWAVETLGMKLGLAKVYVKENWGKVEV